MSSAFTTRRRPFSVGPAVAAGTPAPPLAPPPPPLTTPTLAPARFDASASLPAPVAEPAAPPTCRPATAATSSRFSEKPDGSTPACCSAAFSSLTDQVLSPQAEGADEAAGAWGGVRPVTGTLAIRSSSIASSSCSSPSPSMPTPRPAPPSSAPISSDNASSAIACSRASSRDRTVRASAED
eukprot:scaffold2802_cov110-Isochrysis_galbana.AAC.15